MKNIYFVIIVLLVSGCELLYDCLEGDGVYSSTTRAVGEFTNIYNSSEFEVTVIYDISETSITVECDENLQQYIDTYVRNSSLIIEADQDRCLNSVTPIEITVRCACLESVVLSGAGDMELYDFTTDYFTAILTGSGDIDMNDFVINNSLDITNSGSGDVTIDGKGDDATYILSGSGDINADWYKVDDCYVKLSGSGDMYVYFISYLKGTLSGSGDIHYYGDPEFVEIRKTGSGDLIKE